MNKYIIQEKYDIPIASEQNIGETIEPSNSISNILYNNILHRYCNLSSYIIIYNTLL